MAYYEYDQKFFDTHNWNRLSNTELRLIAKNINLICQGAICVICNIIVYQTISEEGYYYNRTKNYIGKTCKQIILESIMK